MKKPLILKEGSYTSEDFKKYTDLPETKIVDIFTGQLKEFFEISNPQIKGEEFEEKFKEFFNNRTKNGEEISGNLVYFDWNNTLLRTLTEEENDLLRSNRNRNIITLEEQVNLRKYSVAIAGLSVGGNIATSLAYNGFSKKLKIADFDTLETSNLNRVRAKLSDIGSPKIEIIYKQLYDLDPYMDVISFEKGLTKENLNDFLDGTNLVFEIIDDLELKILIRKEAQKRKIPVVMMTSIGDSVMIDIERYDTDPQTKVFNGLVDETAIDDILAGRVPKAEVNKYVVQIVGRENIPPKVLESVMSIGKNLVGRPQLMSTVTTASGLACYVARRIALGENIPSGRILFKFDDLIK